MTKHVIRCKRYGKVLAAVLDGGWCACEPGQCRELDARTQAGRVAHTDPERGPDGDGEGR